MPTDLDDVLTVPSPCCRPSYGAHIEILREACVSQASQSLSTLVETGHVGLPLKATPCTCTSPAATSTPTRRRPPEYYRSTDNAL